MPGVSYSRTLLSAAIAAVARDFMIARSRHSIAPMVIRLRNPHGKPFPSGPAKSSDIIAFSISPAVAVRARLHPIHRNA
jgi:hypothetical protein